MLMAATGLVLFGFVVAHMLGNLQIYLGQDALNNYSAMLKSLPELLWTARAVLLASLVAHVTTAVILTIENKKARGTPYVFQDTVQASYASRTMMMSGVIVLCFVVYHLLHFTFDVTNPEVCDLLDPKGRDDVYSMVVLSFRNVYISAVYILAMIPLALHISHGVSSLFQSLGLSNSRTRPIFTRLARGFALLIFLGNSSIPVSVLLNVIKLPGKGA